MSRIPTSRRPAAQRNAGVTLIELLIAMTLVSILSSGIFMALRVGLTALERSNNKLMMNRRVAGVRRIIDSQIANLVPVSGACTTQGIIGSLPSVFFEGQPQSMRAVTTYSLAEAARGYPRILEYLVIPGESGEGVRLVVNELYYAGPSSLAMLCLGVGMRGEAGPVMQTRPPQATPDSFVLADKLAYCRLSYLKFNEQMRQREWLSVWNAAGLPAAIRIDMKQLIPDPSRLQLTTITLPVHANRKPFEQYDDIDPQPQAQ